MQISRFTYLDGIRGLAALFVLTRHTQSFWGVQLHRVYLAVDLFFILSGFVISYAYGKRLLSGDVKFWDLVKIRLIRLYPMYFISVVLCISIGAREFALSEGSFSSFNQLLFTAGLSLLILPSIFSVESLLFPLNVSFWSLFFELIVNFLYALMAQKLSGSRLIGVVCFFGLIIGAAALHYHNLNVGFTWGVGSIIVGFSRAAFGFFVGVLIHRQLVKNREIFRWVGSWSACFAFVVVAVVLVSPSFGKIDFLADFFSVVFVFPLCVIAASSGKAGALNKVFSILGSASYPVYVLHFPIGYIVSNLARGTEASVAPYSGFAFVVLLVAFSYWLEKFVDIPIRKMLSGIFLRRAK